MDRDAEKWSGWRHYRYSLNTVKVQNWDKTITTIPTYALVSDSFKNWRGMLDRKYIIQQLELLLNIPSPSGYCMDIMKHVQEETERLGYSLELTPKGNGIITIPGQNTDKVIGISAHLDTLGAMVRSIKPNGTIRFTPIGGYAIHTVDIYPHYGSDASAALRGGSDIRAALIGPGVHASHGMERTHADAIKNTAALLLAYVIE